MFPIRRPRRLRRTPAIRSLVRETRLSVDQLVQPLFVRPGTDVERPIESLHGQAQLSADRAAKRAAELAELGVRSVILFGIPESKDSHGREAVDPNGVVPQAVRAIKAACPDLVVIGDVCLCEFTDHAHCGVLRETRHGPSVDNDETIELLAKESLVLAEAGCDIVAPSAMADGQVEVIRSGLDDHGHEEVSILAYSAKYASAFYGPFREAAENAPESGDRRGYQMDPANAREAFVECELDIEEGADIIMVKPALTYLDVIAQLRDEIALPIAAYHVSGEYAMIHAAADRGWIDRDVAMEDSLISIRRAGADMIISYATEWYARREASRRA